MRRWIKERGGGELFVVLLGFCNYFFFLQGAVVLFAWKTLFMKSTQLGNILKKWQTFYGHSICQWLAMLHVTKWVSSKKWVNLAAEATQSTSLYVSWTSQVRNACCVTSTSYPLSGFLRITILPLEMRGLLWFWFFMLQKWPSR